MGLQQIAQQLRGVRDRVSTVIADALSEIETRFTTVYRDMGLFRIDNSSSGIRKELLVSPQFNILASNGNTVAGRIYSERGNVIIELVDVRTLAIRDSLQDLDVLVNSGEVAIYSRSPAVQRLAAMSGYMDPSTGDFDGALAVLGGPITGPIGTVGITANKNYADQLFTFVDAVDGDSTIYQKVNAANGSAVEIKKGADNEVIITVGSVAVVQTISNASHTTTLKPESVATSRLGVGAAAPATDGHAVVNTFLGAASTSPSSGEKLRVGGNARIDSNLGIAMNPSRALDVTGNAKIDGTFEATGNATFGGTVTISPLASGDVLLAQVGGTITTIDPATARFNLDVYSKAETDAAIAAAIAAIVISTVGDHTHGGAVGGDGGHTHTIS